MARLTGKPDNNIFLAHHFLHTQTTVFNLPTHRLFLPVLPLRLSTSHFCQSKKISHPDFQPATISKHLLMPEQNIQQATLFSQLQQPGRPQCRSDLSSERRPQTTPSPAIKSGDPHTPRILTTDNKKKSTNNVQAVNYSNNDDSARFLTECNPTNQPNQHSLTVTSEIYSDPKFFLI